MADTVKYIINQRPYYRLDGPDGAKQYHDRDGNAVPVGATFLVPAGALVDSDGDLPGTIEGKRDTHSVAVECLTLVVTEKPKVDVIAVAALEAAFTVSGTPADKVAAFLRIARAIEKGV